MLQKKKRNIKSISKNCFSLEETFLLKNQVRKLLVEPQTVTYYSLVGSRMWYHVNIIIVMLLQLQGDFLVSNQEKCFMCCSKPFSIFFYFAKGKKMMMVKIWILVGCYNTLPLSLLLIFNDCHQETSFRKVYVVS